MIVRIEDDNIVVSRKKFYNILEKVIMIEWQKFTIQPTSTIRESIAKIDNGATQIVLVIDENNLLQGVITDGDVRRSILQGISIDEPAMKIMNANPVTALPTDSKENILNIMRNKMLRQIPIVDDKGKVVGLEYLNYLIQPQVHPNIVVLMVGGLGTRLRPLTNECPKPLLKIGNKPLLETILESFIEFGFYRFYLSVNYKAEMVKEYFNDGSKWNIEIKYIHENKTLGTAGPLSLLPEKTKHPIIVMNGDLLTKINYQHLLEYHKTNQAIATMCIREYEFRVPYGVVKTNLQKIVSIDEKPLHRFFVNAGIYVLDPYAVNHIPSNTYFDMPALFQVLIDSNQQVIVFPVREYWIDIGREDDYHKANYEFFNHFI